MKIRSITETEYVVSDLQINDLHKQHFCIFDLEATGPSPEEDYITQIGAYKLGQLGTTANREYITLVKPGIQIPEKIERLTGITNEDVESARNFSVVFDEFREFCKGSILVTHAGYEYDIPLLEKECERNNILMLEAGFIDTKALFTYLHPEVTDIISTNYLIEYFKINDQDITRHNALGDSKLIGRIFRCLLDECAGRGIDSIKFVDLVVKKVRLQPLS